MLNGGKAEGAIMDRTPRNTLASLGARADRRCEQWRLAGLLIRALADDPDAEAVLSVFHLERGKDGRASADPGDVARARPALGRAIRKVMQDGGPEITDPSYLLAMFVNGNEPESGEIPRFKGGEPVEEPDCSAITVAG